MNVKICFISMLIIFILFVGISNAGYEIGTSNKSKICTPGQYSFNGGNIVYICNIYGNEWLEKLDCYYGVGYKDCHYGCIDGVHFGGFYCLEKSNQSGDDTRIVYGTTLESTPTLNKKSHGFDIITLIFSVLIFLVLINLRRR